MSAPPPRSWAREGHDWPNRDASRFVRAGTVSWHVQRMGKGPTLLLLHGTGGATHSWRDLMPMLAKDWDVIAPDLPGHGFTRAVGGAASLPAMAAAIGGLLDAEDAAPDMIVGHSAGAAIAVQMALTGAGARSLIGLNAALTPFRGVAGALFPSLARTLALNPVTPMLFAGLAGWQAQARRLIENTGSKLDARGLALYALMLSRPEHVAGALTMMASWDLEPLAARLADLSTPLHLIVGSNDRAVAPGDARALADHHDVITCQEVDGFGHLLHEEAPRQIADMIGEIAATGPGPGST